MALFDNIGDFRMRSKNEFHDPFMLDSNQYIPEDFYKSLEVARYLAVKQPIYTQAVKRTVSFFLTSLEFMGSNGDQKQRDTLKRILETDMNLWGTLLRAGMEYFIYGNSFVRINYPFRRYLIDRRGDKLKLYALDAFGQNIKFNLSEMKYYVPDPMYKGESADSVPTVGLEFFDRKLKRPEGLSFQFIDPRQMVLNTNMVSGKTEYIYRFEEFFTAAIRQGDKLYQVNDTPMDMLKAIKNDQDFMFNTSAIFHFRHDFISGLSYNGWGIPNILLNYSNLHMSQVYQCINESVGKDYLLPFRLITPAAATGSMGDIANVANLASWREATSNIIAAKRRDQTSIFTVPYPVQYQELGASGKSLAPVELMQMQDARTLDAYGLPAELYKMSLQTNAIPTAIRLFQAVFSDLYRCMNRMVKWASVNVQNYLEHPLLEVQLSKPSVADDMEMRHVWLQLASGGEISREMAYKAFNIDHPVEEARKRQKEDIEIQKSQQTENKKFERESTMGSANQVVDAMIQTQQQDSSGGGGGGAMPPQGAGIPPLTGGTDQTMTPLDLESQAEQYAMQLLNMDEHSKLQMMSQLRASKPTLYAVIQSKMEKIRADGAAAGRAQAGKQ